MSSEWWTKVNDAYHTGRELRGEERSRFLEAACLGDAAMRREIELMLEDAIPRVPGIGDQLGTYSIEASIAEGGMGVVYRARDTRLNRSVAIKFLSGHLGCGLWTWNRVSASGCYRIS